MRACSSTLAISRGIREVKPWPILLVGWWFHAYRCSASAGLVLTQSKRYPWFSPVRRSCLTNLFCKSKQRKRFMSRRREHRSHHGLFHLHLAHMNWCSLVSVGVFWL